jgi:hypothetical protein
MIMQSSDIVRAVMDERGVSLAALARDAGLPDYHYVQSFLRSADMRAGSLVRLLDAMGYELIARPRRRPLGAGYYVVTPPGD